eukprot:267322-Pelagomonas_calceolata.AAC.1
MRTLMHACPARHPQLACKVLKLRKTEQGVEKWEIPSQPNLVKSTLWRAAVIHKTPLPKEWVTSYTSLFVAYKFWLPFAPRISGSEAMVERSVYVCRFSAQGNLWVPSSNPGPSGRKHRSSPKWCQEPTIRGWVGGSALCAPAPEANQGQSDQGGRNFTSCIYLTLGTKETGSLLPHATEWGQWVIWVGSGRVRTSGDLRALVYRDESARPKGPGHSRWPDATQ